MRLSIANTIQSRDGTLDKDAKLVNCYVEQLGDEAIVYKRPGLDQRFDNGAGQGQGMICWQSTLFTVSGGTLTQGPTSAPYPNGATWTIGSNFPAKNFDKGATFVFNGEFYGMDNNGGFIDFIKTSNGTSFTTILNGASPFGGFTTVRLAQLGGIFYALPGLSNSVYKSVDNGVNWTQITASANWSPRLDQGFIGFNGFLWVIGGDIDGFGSHVNDVWKSADGITWTQVTASAGFSARKTPTVFIHKNLIYVAGGNASATLKNDVWSSPDGVTWTQRTAAASWTAGEWPMVTSHLNRLYAVGSGAAVYKSADDGVTWPQVTSNAGFSISSGVLASFGSTPDLFFAITNWNTYVATNNTSGDHTYTLTGANDLPVSMTQTSGAASTEYLVVKTTGKAWVLTFGQPGTLTQITDVDFPATTVPGVVYLDGFFFVMNTAGEIYNSAIEDPTSWGALDFISAEVEPDNAIALAKHQNYVVALKDTTTELFFDAATASGSPLARLSNAALQVGCANGYSVASLDGALFFMSKTKSNERSVHYFPVDGITPIEVGSAAIRRILTNADITTVHCFAARLDGHSFYVVNLVTEGITLAYSLTSQTWAQWTFQTVTASKSISSLTQIGGVATATSTTHGFSDGDSITVSGATPSGYNGTFNVNVTNANTFTYVVSDSLATPATGTITATGWTEGYFPFGFFATCGGVDFVQHETNGKIYEISKAYSDDEGAVIDVFVRTGRFDGGNSNRKSLHSINVVSDNIDGDLLVRRSDDDYVTFSKYKRIDLSQKKKQSRRFGEFYQRSMDFRYTGSGRLRITAVDIDLDQAR